MDLDISQVADDQPFVFLRWTMGSTDVGWTYSGWNIDDIELSGISGNLNPIELVYFYTNSAEVGIDLSWMTATETDVQGFNLYRAETDDFASAEQINSSLIPGAGTTTEPVTYLSRIRKQIRI